ncbi:MAG: S8 family serine peptidase, partial [candidate division Zixibacteria bacterium]|nr:S8 family serine peptidase [candidate division Zixibacteria bacterium]
MRRVTLFSFFIGAIFLTFLFSIGASAGVINPNDDIMTLLYTPKSLPVVESSLINLPPDNSVKIWVYFTDKNIFSNDNLTVALDNTKNALTDRALKRRAKTRGENVVDFRDISMNDDYIYQIETAGAEVKHRIKWLNAVSANVQVSDIRKIGALPFVRKIERVKSLGAELYEINTKSNLSPNPPVITESSYDYGVSESQLEQINAPPAHELGFNGEGIIICMLDVGYRKDHQAFVPAFDDGRVLAEWDFINNDGNTDLDQGDDPTQANHGTLCWSTLGGQAPGHLYGPSFGAFFILGKTEDVTSERHIEEDNWAAAALWADSIGAEVISASLGYRWFDPGEGDYEYEDLDGNTTIVTQAADLAAYNGIAVCTANGNEGYMGPGSLIAPADGDSVIGCGAIDAYGEAAGFTSQGPTYDDRMKPEVNARGVGTDCADPYDMNGYTTANGTSLSTP